MRTCIIFNPTAKGNRARRFRRHLGVVGSRCTLLQTAAAEDARRLASQAVRDGFEIVIAAGGDGTLNEVLNGIADVPEGFDRTRLGVLPLGTVNVFARELGIPLGFEPAWQTVLQAKESRIDLPRVEYQRDGSTHHRYFAQLAGAGMDARAIELVNWSLKKNVGPLAYIFAGLRALLQSPTKITVTAGPETATGELVLIGNGRLYGGNFRVFPEANMRDGLLEITLFPRVNWWTLLRCSIPLLLRGRLPAGTVKQLRCASFALTSSSPTPVEVDGELIGHLPASFSLQPSALRVLVP